MEQTITFDDFLKIDLRVGTIVSIDDFPQAKKPAYKLIIDFGPLGMKKSSAQITQKYTKESLIGKQVLCVVNFPKKQIGPFMSECLTTGFVEESGVTLATVDGKVANGLRLL